MPRVELVVKCYCENTRTVSKHPDKILLCDGAFVLEIELSWV